jgi:hypothetical protein
MTECIPCPALQNMSSWILLIPQKSRANASDADLLSAAVAVDASCLQMSVGIRSNFTYDAISTSSDGVIAIFCTLAGIILMMGLYFLKRWCTAAPHTDATPKVVPSADETPKAPEKAPEVKAAEVSVPISQVPEDIRSKVMVQLGGAYFHQLIERRQRLSEVEPRGIELYRIPSDPVVQQPMEISVPVTARIMMPQTPDEEFGGTECVNEAGGQPAQSSDPIPSSDENVESEPQENPMFTEHVLSSKNTLNTGPHFSGERDHQQESSFTEPKQYQGKKYTIDFENVHCVASAGGGCMFLISPPFADKIHSKGRSQICRETSRRARCCCPTNRHAIAAS